MSTRTQYEADLAALKGSLAKMSQLSADAVEDALEALCTADAEEAKGIIKGDTEVNRMERDIEQQCLTLLLTQSPVAGDWRRNASIMRMIADLERIADHCADISEYVIKLSGKDKVDHIPYFSEMFALMQKMVQDTVQAYVDLDVEKARLDKVYGNEKLIPVVTALGCGIGEEFDITKLRYHKVFIMADADVDGSHICTLMLTFFFRFMRPLIEGGYVYIAQPRLFKLAKG